MKNEYSIIEMLEACGVDPTYPDAASMLAAIWLDTLSKDRKSRFKVILRQCDKEKFERVYFEEHPYHQVISTMLSNELLDIFRQAQRNFITAYTEISKDFKRRLESLEKFMVISSLVDNPGSVFGRDILDLFKELLNRAIDACDAKMCMVMVGGHAINDGDADLTKPHRLIVHIIKGMTEIDTEVWYSGNEEGILMRGAFKDSREYKETFIRLTGFHPSVAHSTLCKNPGAPPDMMAILVANKRLARMPNFNLMSDEAKSIRIAAGEIERMIEVRTHNINLTKTSVINDYIKRAFEMNEILELGIDLRSSEYPEFDVHEVLTDMDGGSTDGFHVQTSMGEFDFSLETSQFMMKPAEIS